MKKDKKLGQERRENTQERPTGQTRTWHAGSLALLTPSICFTINVTQCTTAPKPKDTLCISVRRPQL